MIADEIGAYLQGLGLATPAVDLFFNDEPGHAPPASTFIYEYGGSAGTRTQEIPGITIEHPRLQVLRRDADQDAARTVIEQLYSALAKVENRTLSGVRYLIIEPLSPPFLLGRDQARRYQFVFNCEVSKAPSI